VLFLSFLGVVEV